MSKVLDKIGEAMIGVIRKDGWFDQCVWKLIAAMPRRGANKQEKI
jgi:hypothetical protein